MKNLGISVFGKKFSEDTGIRKLMDDMARAVATPGEKSMFGGGNPAIIPEVVAAYQAELQKIVDDERQFVEAFGNYDTPRGNQHFMEVLADYLRRNLGWQVSARNIAMTPGSQAGFFLLFNMLAGEQPDGSHKKILFPVVPEYIGYADQGIAEQIFTANRPDVRLTGDHSFSYSVDYKKLRQCEDIAAVAVSRPTNPTGNMVTRDELTELSSFARERNVPLIIDAAYGFPFPGVVEDPFVPEWNDGMIYSLSLSKIGLPGVRSGIFVASEEVATRLGNMNAILSLANANAGPLIVSRLIENDRINDLSSTYIQPFYREKQRLAEAVIADTFDDSLPYKFHEYQGSYFFWLWLDECKKSSYELYERLKDRGVIVVPGEYFFPGLEDDNWQHKKQCLRINFARPQSEIERGFKIMGEEIKKLYD